VCGDRDGYGCCLGCGVNIIFGFGFGPRIRICISIMGIDTCKASYFFRSRIAAIWNLRLCDKLFVHRVISSVCDVTIKYAPDAFRHAWIEMKPLGISYVYTGISLKTLSSSSSSSLHTSALASASSYLPFSRHYLPGAGLRALQQHGLGVCVPSSVCIVNPPVMLLVLTLSQYYNDTAAPLH
jgi:hypothetical protein